MNPLTKEQVDWLDEYVDELYKFTTMKEETRDRFKEATRGYRAWLAEVEHHKAEEKECINRAARWRAKRNGAASDSCEFKANYHRARLAALQAELKGEG